MGDFNLHHGNHTNISNPLLHVSSVYDFSFWKFNYVLQCNYMRLFLIFQTFSNTQYVNILFWCSKWRFHCDFILVFKFLIFGEAGLFFSLLSWVFLILWLDYIEFIQCLNSDYKFFMNFKIFLERNHISLVHWYSISVHISCISYCIFYYATFFKALYIHEKSLILNFIHYVHYGTKNIF